MWRDLDHCWRARGFFGIHDVDALCDLSEHFYSLLSTRVPSAPPMFISSLLSRAKRQVSDAKDAGPTKSSASGGGPEKKREPWKVVLDKVDLNQLTDIDSKLRCFTAYVYVELLVLNAADDPTMSAPGVVPPKPPELLASAGWYLERLMPVNGKNFTILDSTVRKAGPHLLMLKSFRGTFYESMELSTFPFDAHGLAVTLAFLNRKNGPFGVDFVVSKELKQGIDFFGFNLNGCAAYRVNLPLVTLE